MLLTAFANVANVVSSEFVNSANTSLELVMLVFTLGSSLEEPLSSSGETALSLFNISDSVEFEPNRFGVVSYTNILCPAGVNLTSNL